MQKQNRALRRSVERKVPGYVRIIVALLYAATLLFTILGAMFGILFMPLALGSLFGGWYLMGEARVIYEYRLDGRTLTVMRTSGMRSRQKEIEFAVASAYHLPLADASVGLVLNCFSPLAAEEFARVLRPGGTFLYVVPSARHLWEMKAVLYDRPYENPVRRESYPGFVWQGVEQVRYSLSLTDPADITALFHMTPYAWKTPKSGVQRLAGLDRLDTQAGFDIHCYQKI